jgi:hypothetical protein
LTASISFGDSAGLRATVVGVMLASPISRLLASQLSVVEPVADG